MNLSKLFETQNVLRERIGYKGPDRFEKLKLALLVELGECANELPEVFKFWSSKKKNNYEKALMEYVDGLHFVLEIGLEIHSKFHVPYKRITLRNEITKKFNAVYRKAATLDELELLVDDHPYELLVTEYIELGELLGFTWEQVQAAYFSKNYINHQRQDAGY